MRIRRMILLTLAMAAFTGSFCVSTGKAETVSKEKGKKQKVIVIDAGHQTHAMSATEPNGPGSKTRKAKVTGDKRLLYPPAGI